MIEPAALSRVLGDVEASAQLAEKLAMHAEHAHGENSRDAQAARKIAEHAQSAERGLRRFGVEPEQDAKARAAAFDLAALAELDAGKPEALDLAARLRDLLPIALDLDVKRGRVVSAKVPLGPGETPSTDVAEILSDLCARLEREAGVGVGAGRE